MFRKTCLLFVILTYLLCESNGSLAPFIKPCKSDDTDCLLTSSQNAVPYLAAGIPQLGVPPNDPLILKNINADQGDLKLSFKDMELAGTSQIKILSLTRDVEKSTMTLDIECPLRATGTYTLSGKLLFIPAEGDGDFEIKTDKVQISVTFKYKTITGNGGKKHWKITSFDYSYDLIERAYIRLDNLFGGDETRAKPVLDILNNSWKTLITEIGAPIIKETLNKAVDSVNKFFTATPTTDLELS